VHLRAVRTTTDDIVLSWVRRSRIDADGWEGDDVPLDEDVEAYRLQILDGAAVVCTASVSGPAFVYTDAMQSADFGASQNEISFRVRQKGSRVALGIAAQTTVVL